MAKFQFKKKRAKKARYTGYPNLYIKGRIGVKCYQEFLELAHAANEWAVKEAPEDDVNLQDAADSIAAPLKALIYSLKYLCCDKDGDAFDNVDDIVGDIEAEDIIEVLTKISSALGGNVEKKNLEQQK